MQKNQNTIINVNKADLSDIQTIAEFQICMAKETENLQLDRNLINNGVKYFIQNAKSSNQLGFYIAARTEINSNIQTIGCLMVTFQNPRKWWLQSLYVHKNFRMKGAFRSMFKKLIQIGKQNKVEKISLYAETNNQRAINIYTKFGMYIQTVCMWGYDYAYGVAVTQNQFSKSLQQIIVDLAPPRQILIQYQNILGLSISASDIKNKPIQFFVKNENDPYLFAQYFYQFSDWRFGLCIYISKLYIHKSKNFKNSIKTLVEYIKNTKNQGINKGIKIQAIRFLISEQNEANFNQIMQGQQGISKLHYYVISIQC